MCIKFRDHCQLVCLDDKHKCKVGEPGLPVAAIERGKQVFPPMERNLLLQIMISQNLV